MNDHRSPGVPTGAFPDVVPVLTRGAVRLRPMAEADLPALVEQSNDAECVRWTTVAQPYGPDQAREFLQRQAHEWGEPAGRRYWAVERLGDDETGGTPLRRGDRRAPRPGGRLGLRPRGAEPVLVLRGVGAVDAWVASRGHVARPRGHLVHRGRGQRRPARRGPVFVREGTLVEGGTAELGYALRPSARGRGVAGNRVLTGAGFTPWGREEAADAPDGSQRALHWERLA
ncbi:GNAT family N-acetyltransferase [Janibacter terrae]|uniref:GNAT family N-acetyltransferase n=1 Tax=Janibacter terrae TaxID=103817 RepID=UPI0008393D42|nr:GNAT family N-acetyltransferase [Janibacter terrae]